MATTTKPRARRGLFRDQRGTATLEAAVLLPIMAICWLGLFYKLQVLDTTLQAANEARRSAWTASNAGCRGDDVDYDCHSETGSEEGGGWLDQMGDLPFVGWLFGSVFGYSTTARVSHDVTVPPMFGGGTQRAGYGYYIMCNERPMTIDDLLKATICEQFSALGLDIGFAVDCPPPRHDAPASCME